MRSRLAADGAHASFALSSGPLPPPDLDDEDQDTGDLPSGIDEEALDEDELDDDRVASRSRVPGSSSVLRV